MPLVLMTIEYPSGAECATSSTPRLPPAPGLFSTEIGWPRTLVISMAAARVAMSTAPAGGKGTTMRSGLEGKAWLHASSGASNAIANRRNTGRASGGRGRARIMADLNHVVSIEDLRQIAKRPLPRAIFDFFDGGAEDEVTLRDNRAAFERVR